MKKLVRLRFAPSPTGMMHLGNIRAALMNAIYAKKYNGTFILRIEDTDPSRNFDPGAHKIMEDLSWLGLHYQEGPKIGGPYTPYYQSERTALYQAELQTFIERQQTYRCFCTTEELEKRKARQVALKKPPRYDRTCLNLSEQNIKEKIAQNIPFIWRFKIDSNKKITIHDLAHGTMTFDMHHFSDFPLSRSDGSFTFLFANFVDDMLMKISHVVRGEDHLTNTACQAILFDACNVEIPTFWHLPVLCNIEGKKLSKRDFGFSLRDLKKEGYLPEAILNYLAIIGGGSYKDEIMDFTQLAATIDFEHISATGQVKFDPEKLNWLNNKWIHRLTPQDLTARCLPYLQEVYPEVNKIPQTELEKILSILKTDFTNLHDAIKAVRFYFKQPQIATDTLATFTNNELLRGIVSELLEKTTDSQNFITTAKEAIKDKPIKIKDLFGFIRLGLMGSMQGPSIHDLLEVLGIEESKKRLLYLITF